MNKTLLTIFFGTAAFFGCHSTKDNEAKTDTISTLDTNAFLAGLTAETTKPDTFSFINKIYFSRGHRMNFTGNTLLFLDNNVCLINGDIHYFDVNGNNVTTNDQSSSSHKAINSGKFLSGNFVESSMQQNDTGLFTQYRLNENRDNPFFAIAFDNILYCLRPMDSRDEEGLRYLKSLYQNKVNKLIDEIVFQNNNNITTAERSIISNRERALTPGGEEAYNELINEYHKQKKDFDKNLKELNNLAKVIQLKSSMDFYKPSELLNLSKKIREIKNFNWLFQEYIDAVASNYPLNTSILEEKRNTIIQNNN